MRYKLPYLNIIAAAVFFAWSNRTEFFRATALPTLILVVLWAVWADYSEAPPPYLSLLFLLGYGLGFSFLAVTCHRLILVDDVDRHKTFKARPGYRELRFLGWVVVIYAIDAILEFLAQILVLDASGGVFIGDDGKLADWAKQIASIPALYVFARLSLAFPATAIDMRSGLRWSWARTQGNGWRIFVVVALFPWLADVSVDLLWREEATLLEQVALSIVTFVGLAIEIIALSFAYKELARHYAANVPSLSGGMVPMSADVSRVSFHELARDGESPKLFVAMSVLAALGAGYLLIGSLGSQFADCSSEVISSASSPGGAYEAKLLNRTCKDEKAMQGLILDVAKATTPRTIHSYPLSGTVAGEVELAWTSEKGLVVRYAGALDVSDIPAVIDDIQVVFEKRPDR